MVQYIHATEIALYWVVVVWRWFNCNIHSTNHEACIKDLRKCVIVGENCIWLGFAKTVQTVHGSFQNVAI